MLVSAFSELTTPLASGYPLTSNSDFTSETSTVIKWLMSEFSCQLTTLLYLEYCPGPLPWTSLFCSPQSLEPSTRKGTSRGTPSLSLLGSLQPKQFSRCGKGLINRVSRLNHNPAIPTTPHHTCCLEGFIRKRGRKEVGGGREGWEDRKKDPTDRGNGG